MHLWKEYNLPFYFRPFLDIPLAEYDIIETDNGWKMKISNVVRRRVFVEDIPSMMNLDPYTKQAMVGVEVEKAKVIAESIRKSKGVAGGGEKTMEQALIEYEHDEMKHDGELTKN